MEITLDGRLAWKLYDLFIWPLGIWLVWDYWVWPLYCTYRPGYPFFLAMSFAVVLTEVRFSSVTEVFDDEEVEGQVEERA